jgi:putative heme iron utilization protein
VRAAPSRPWQNEAWLNARLDVTDIDDANSECQALLNAAERAHLATLGAAGNPEASYAPCVRHEGDYYLFLSALSAHTGNLMRDDKIGILLLDEAAAAPNPFARPRVTLRGKVEIVARESALFAGVLAEFRGRFGEIVRMLESLPDFTLFRIRTESGTYIRGFGQAYALSGERLEKLHHLDPRE